MEAKQKIAEELGEVIAVKFFSSSFVLLRNITHSHKLMIYGSKKMSVMPGTIVQLERCPG